LFRAGRGFERLNVLYARYKQLEQNASEEMEGKSVDRIRAVERRIEKVKQNLAKLGDMRPGSLSVQRRSRTDSISSLRPPGKGAHPIHGCGT